MIAQHISSLFSKYCRKGILIDSNLLLLYFVGMYDEQWVPRFKRTHLYTREDFALLRHLVCRFTRVVTTPNILTEVSNLSNQMHDDVKLKYRHTFATHVSALDEQYRQSRDVCKEACFPEFGLTDSAIVDVSSDSYLVLTDDLRLSVLLHSRGVDVVNFNHIRTSVWNRNDFE